MQRSDRRPTIQFAITTLTDLDRQLADLLAALTKVESAAEVPRHSEGDHGDPTLDAVVRLVSSTAVLDEYLHQMADSSRGIHALLRRCLGAEPEHDSTQGPPEPREEDCQSCARIKVAEPLWVRDPDTGRRRSTARNARVYDPTTAGTTPWRVCTWCYKSTLPPEQGGRGRLPTEAELRMHANGQRVYREAS